MRIMLIGAAVSNHIKRWANSMVEKGHDVLLLCRSDQKDEKGEINSAVKIHYLKYGGGIGYYFNIIEARRIYKKYKPDIVNVHYASGYGTMARLARLKPLVISCWGSDVYEYPYRNKFCKYVLKKNLLYANAVASTSYAMAKQAKRIIDNKDVLLTITPFGVDVKRFAPIARKENDRPIIGIVKYLEPIYDVSLLIKAFSIIYNREIVKPVLDIYGDGSLKEELIKLSEQLSISEAVHFNGTIPNTRIPDVLNTFDVFVNCSKEESFGVAVVEAMACEIPVVVTDTEGFREVTINKETGFVLDDRNPNTMADAITTLLHDKQLRKKMGINGRKRVLELYDWDKNVSVMENLYIDVVKYAKK